VTMGKKRGRGLCILTGSPIRSFRPCCETALAFACVGVLPCLPPPHSSFSLSYHSLSPLPPSHAVVCLSFFFSSFSCESSSLVRAVVSRPYHVCPSLCIQFDSPACPFERLVKNHDVRQRRLFFIPSLLYSCNIAPIALSTWHATLSRRSHLVSRSLGTLLHPKSLHCRI
jgi:hypothetical protein